MELTTQTSLIERVDHFLSKTLIILIPLSFVVGYLVKTFMPQLKWTATWMLFTIMFTSTYGLRIQDFLNAGTFKKQIFLGLSSQLLLLPLIAFFVSKTLYANFIPWGIGHLCVAASPAAISTIIWSRITGGNVALAVILVGIHVLLIPFTAPITLKLFIGRSAHVPLEALFLKLLIAVFIPTILAVFIFEKTQNTKPKTFFSAWAKFGMLYMIVLNTSVAFSSVPINPKTLYVLLIMAVQVVLFYSTGFALGYLTNSSKETRITLSYFMGMKNNGAALVMALSGFPPAATFPVALAIMCQQPMASILDRIWRKR